jgi:putative membrane protein
MKINPELLNEIEKNVRECEKLSAIEYVPVLVERSANYRFFRLSLSFLIFVGVAATLWIFFPELHLVGKIAVPLAVALFIFAVSGLKNILAFLLPKAFIFEEVERMARLKFLEHEVFATEQRSGILILISALERSVYVLADKGFKDRVENHYWIQLGNKLADGFNRRAPTESFLKALSELSQQLSKDFPAKTDNPNELPDHLRQ